MTILDAMSMPSAIPSIKLDLNLSPQATHWTVTAYAIAFSGPLLVFGRAADRWGRRRLLLVVVLAPLLREPNRGPKNGRAFGLASGLILTTTLALLVFVITETPTTGILSWFTGGLCLVVLVLATLLTRIERSAAEPIIPPVLLQSRIVIGGNLGGLIAGVVVDGMLITLTGYAQLSLKWSVFEFGPVTSVMTVTSIVGGMCAQRVVVRRIGLRNLVAVGTSLLAAACLGLAATSSAGLAWPLVCALSVFGAGLGGTMVGSQFSALTGVLETPSGVASGPFDTSFSTGSALGVAICSSVAVVPVDVAWASLPLSRYASAFPVAAAVRHRGLPQGRWAVVMPASIWGATPVDSRDGDSHVVQESHRAGVLPDLTFDLSSRIFRYRSNLEDVSPVGTGGTSESGTASAKIRAAVSPAC